MNDLTQALSIDTLGDLDDGTLRHLVNTALQEALNDCDNRAMLTNARRVAVTLGFQPVIDDHGAMKGVEVTAKVNTVLPPRAGRRDYLRANIHGDNVRAYLPDAHQDTLFRSDKPNPEEAS